MLFYLLFHASVCILIWSMFNGSWQLYCATALFTILYSGYGISVGYHRLHSHNSFKTWEPIRKLLLYLGVPMSTRFITWSPIHNRSHAKTDTVNDVHTPN